MGIYLEFAILLVLILANGFLSMSEMSLVSARKARLRQQADEGDANAERALKLAESPAQFLSTVQVGITLIGILTGAFGGAALSNSLAPIFAQIPLIAPYATGFSVFFVVIVTTYLSLILGELAPKRIALNSAERIARMVAPIMGVLAWLARPLNRLLSGSTDLVLRLIGVRPSTESPVTDEEIRILIEQGTESGVFEPIEEEIVQQLFRLSDLTVGALLTPRTDVEWLDVHDTPEEIGEQLRDSNHSRYPVADKGLDSVVGVLLVKDLFTATLAGKPIDVTSVMQPPLFIPDSTPALEVLERLRQTRTHIALVIDEYGGLEGLVTLADFVEAIIGAVPEIGDSTDPQSVQRADGSWLLDGMMPIDRFQQQFDIKELPHENEGYYQTLGGFVMSTLGRVPSVGDLFEWQNVQLEVVDMDGRRVDKVLATVLPDHAGDA